MHETKIKFQELKDALEYLEKYCGEVDVSLFFDAHGRVLVKGTSFGGDSIIITLFNVETAKFPELTTHKRFTK